MKTNRIKLATWYSNYEIIDVDWPKVQKEIGKDHLEWLLKQQHSDCQIVVDKLNENYTLVAEFYNEKILTCYHLMWAK